MASHSSMLAWRIPRREGPAGSTGSQRVGNSGGANTSHFRRGQPEWAEVEIHPRQTVAIEKNPNKGLCHYVHGVYRNYTQVSE